MIKEKARVGADDRDTGKHFAAITLRPTGRTVDKCKAVKAAINYPPHNKGRLWRGPCFTSLGGVSKEEIPCGTAVAAYMSVKITATLCPSEGMKISFDLLPSARNSGYRLQLIPPAKTPVAASESSSHHLQPAKNKPGAQETLGICFNEGTPEALLSFLPVLETHNESADHGRCAVLHIWNKLDREQRKGLLPFTAKKSGNGDALLPEAGKQIYGTSLIRRNLPVALSLPADGADRPNHRGKVNFTGVKSILILPHAPKAVNIWKLYRGRLFFKGAGLGLPHLFAVPLMRVVIFLRSISYLANLPIFISPVKLFCKYLSPNCRFRVVNNTYKRERLVSTTRGEINWEAGGGKGAIRGG